MNVAPSAALQPYSPSAGTAPLLSSGVGTCVLFDQSIEAMPSTFLVGIPRGPLGRSQFTADLPILTRSVFEGHASRGTALRTAKRQIAVFFWVSDWTRYSKLEGARCSITGI
jgi:hypothetical protein